MRGLLALFLGVVTLVMWGWLFLCPFLFIGGLWGLIIRGEPITWNGQESQELSHKIAFLAFALFGSIASALYLKYARPWIRKHLQAEVLDHG